MKQALNILLAYLTCTDPVVVTKWQNLLASFWHKDDGSIIKDIDTTGNDIVLTTEDGDGNETQTTVAQYQEPAEFPISKITDLANQLADKVDKVVGKQLTTEDFTTALKQKLDGLANYVKPASEPIAYIDGLQDLLDGIAADINGLTATVNGIANSQYIIWNGYRLFKLGAGTEIYPEGGDEIQGRGTGDLEDGDWVHIEVINAMPDIALVVEADYNKLNSYQ